MAKRQPQPLDRDKLLNVALRALGGRAHSSGELRDKLRRRAQNNEDVDAVLAKLKDSGYLNDRHFAENYAAARLQNQGLGKMRVLAGLAPAARGAQAGRTGDRADLRKDQ